MNLTGYKIYDIYGVERIELDGVYDEISLAEKFIYEWIPYFECHKCGKFDYCKFAQKHPANQDRSIDIKCGVAINSLLNFTKHTFKLLKSLPHDQIQDYLDGAFHYFYFIYNAEITISHHMDEDFCNYWGEFAPFLFSNITYLRDSLNNVGKYWKDIQGFHAKQKVLFVEGEAEQIFLEELKKSHLSHFMNLIIETYSGKDNKRLKRIEMLINNYLKQGYSIYIQGDADNKNPEIFNALINAKLINKEKTFVFQKDFESSFPKRLIYLVLNELDVINKIDYDKFKSMIPSDYESINHLIKEICSRNVSKVIIARTAGFILNNLDRPWWTIDDIKESELGKFLEFIQQMN